MARGRSCLIGFIGYSVLKMGAFFPGDICADWFVKVGSCPRE